MSMFRCANLISILRAPGYDPFVSPYPKRQRLRLRKFDEVIEADDGQSGQRKQRLGSSTRLRMAAASHSR